MFSSATKIWTTAWKQYLYKLKAFSFVSLIVMQIIILLLSTSGIGMYGTSNDNLHVNIKMYASDVVIIGTFVWIFVIAFSLTKKESKQRDFTLVSTRFSSCLSDLGLLVTLSLIAGVTASLSGYLLRIFRYLVSGSGLINFNAFKLSPAVFLQGMAAAVLYLLLISAMAYLFGMLAEFHRIFAVLVPALLLGLFRVQSQAVVKVIEFFVAETNLALFAGKVIGVSLLLFAVSSLIFNRMEVRK